MTVGKFPSFLLRLFRRNTWAVDRSGRAMFGVTVAAGVVGWLVVFGPYRFAGAVVRRSEPRMAIWCW